MRRAANLTTGLLFLLLLAGPALGDEDLTAMAAKVRDYRTKFRLIAKGRPAVAPLMAQVGSDDEWLAFESKSALRWIATHAHRHGAEAEVLAREVETWCVIADAQPPAVRAFAAELLGDLGSPDSAGVLGSLIAATEPECLAACHALRRLPGGAAGRVLRDAAKGADGWRRAAILRALGARADPASLPLLLEWAQAGQVGAIRALGDGGYAGAETVLAGLCKQRHPEAFTALLRIARAQADTSMLARLFDHAQDDAQRLAVIDAAGRLPVFEEALIGVLGKAMDAPALRVAAQRALLSNCCRFNRKTAALVYRRILAQAEDDAVIQGALAGLGRVGGEDAVDLVLPHLASPRGAVRTTAIAALGGIPGWRATLALMNAFREAQDPDVQSLLLRTLGERGAVEAVPLLSTWLATASPALRAEAADTLLRMVDLSDPETARGIYLRLLAMGVKEPALRGLGGTGDLGVVPEIEDALEGASDPERAAGRDALTAIAVRLAQAEDREGAVTAFQAALRAGAMVENHLRKLGESIEITAREGRISAWWILGPFPSEGVEDWKRQDFPPAHVEGRHWTFERGGQVFRWQPVQVGGRDAIVDLDGLLTPNEQVAAYAYVEIHVTKARDAVLKMGSDDGLMCWVNGEKVHEMLVPRGLTVDEDVVTVHLEQGKNAIVLKICEAGGGWGFCARLEDLKGRPLKFRIR